MGASDLVFWNLQEMISLEKSVDRYRKFTHGLNKQKLRSFVRTICLVEYITFSASLRYINGFWNTKQFDSICLVYAYLLVESVVSNGKYKDSM